MNALLPRLNEWWTNTDRTTRMIYLGGIAAFTLLLLGVFVFGSRPQYAVLYAGLSDTEKGTLTADIQALGYDCTYDKPGVIEVIASKKSEIRGKLAAAGKAPKSSGSTWIPPELSTMSIMATPKVEQAKLLALLQGEIADAIMTIQGISNARVMVTLPPETAFEADHKDPTASIIVTSTGDALDKGKGLTIAKIVASGVPGLQLKDITVTNQDLKRIFDGKNDGEDGAAPTKKIDIDAHESERRTRMLQNFLDIPFGPGVTVAEVQVDVNIDEEAVDIENLRVSDKPIQKSVTTEKVTGPAKPGILPSGAAANVPGSAGAPATPSGAQGGGDYNGNTTTQLGLPSTEKIKRKKAPGTIASMAINVVVDETVVPDPAKVEEYVRGSILNRLQVDAQGNPVPNQPFTVKVTSIPFNHNAQAENQKRIDELAAQARMQQLISILPIAALLIVAMMVVKSLGKFAKAALPQPVEIATEGYPMALGEHEGMSALEQGEHDPADELLEQIDQHSDDMMIELGLQVDEIKDKVHLPLEQLKKMSIERPTVVAQLIKSMLLEDRR